MTDSLNREIKIGEIIAAAGSKGVLYIGEVVRLNEEKKTVTMKIKFRSGLKPYQDGLTKWFYSRCCVILPEVII